MKLLISLAVFLPSLAFADCPTNWYLPGGPDSYSSSSPVWNFAAGCGSLAVDLPQGTMQLNGGGFSGSEISCSVYLRVSDIYQIVGPASPSPLDITARVHLSGQLNAGFRSDPYWGTICTSNYVYYGLTSESASAIYEDDSNGGGACTPKVIDTERALTLSKLPGEPFTLVFLARLIGEPQGFIRQALVFDGLPTGYSITSCQGYGSNPTPATATSWGALKATYR